MVDKKTDRLAVALDRKDESVYPILDRSTEHLGMGNLVLKLDAMYNCPFALDLDVGRGTVHFAATV